MSWHSSGKFLAFYESTGPQTGSDVVILPMEGDETSGWKPGAPTIFVNDALQDGWPTFSPDGRWLAYHSRDTGPYAVDGDAFLAKKPRLWSEGSFRRSRGLTWRPYDLHPDGERVALAPPAETQVESKHVVLVFNFFDELRRIAPAEKR